MSSNKCFKCGPSSYWAPECSTGGGCGHGTRSHGRGGFTSNRDFQFVSLSLPDTCYHCGKSGYLPRIVIFKRMPPVIALEVAS
uniref:CCHC-type domain-containing protein n=2 Tax=Canis lupus familiaris TaxID=9615 RepID=A0A8C0NH92_CANLF